MGGFTQEIASRSDVLHSSTSGASTWWREAGHVDAIEQLSRVSFCRALRERVWGLLYRNPRSEAAIAATTLRCSLGAA
jgi:hypothetical protein